jgi:hypothetical protein
VPASAVTANSIVQAAASTMLIDLTELGQFMGEIFILSECFSVEILFSVANVRRSLSVKSNPES